MSCCRFSAAFAINSCRNNASGITGTFTAGVKSGNFYVAKIKGVAKDADGSRGARFSGYVRGLVGEETVALGAELLEPVNEARGDELRHPEMER